MSVLHDWQEHIRNLFGIQGTRSSTNDIGAYGCFFVIGDYNHALIIAYSCSEHCWQNGMKAKDEVLAMSKRWIAETPDIQKVHLVLVLVWDNAKENTLKKLNHFFTERGI